MQKFAKIYLTEAGKTYFVRTSLPPLPPTPSHANPTHPLYVFDVPFHSQVISQPPTFTESNFLFSDFMALKGKVFREMKDRRTLQFFHKNQCFFIKKHFGIGWREIIKALLQLRLPIISAASEWYALQRLHQLNLPTVEAIAYGYYGVNPAHVQSFIVSNALQGCISLQDWGEQHFKGVAHKHQVTRQLGILTRRLHENGINHRDYYFCHLWWHIKQQKLYVMDLHRAQLRHRTPNRWKIKDLAALYFCSLGYRVSRRDCLRFLKYYFDKPLHQIFQTHYKPLKKIEQRAIKLYKRCHGREPVVNIL